MVLEAMGDEVLKRLQEDGGEGTLIFIADLEDFARGLEGFFALGIAHLGQDDAGGEGGVEADFDGHGERKVGRNPPMKIEKEKSYAGGPGQRR